jgi:TonB family protein
MPQHTVVLALVCLAAASVAVSAGPQKLEFERLESIRPANVYLATPTLQTIFQPLYTPEALQAKVEGDVALEVVLTADGTVGDVRVTRSLDRQFGLDDQAVAAARQWQFARDGRPTPVTLHMALQFRLPDAGQPVANLEFEKGVTRDDVDGLVKPIVIKDAKPTYTPEAMRSHLQGVVDVQVVVGTDGTVARARAVKAAWVSDTEGAHLRSAAGLVDTALAAAKKWTFTPGTLNGTPVPVLTTVTLRFRLH